MNLSRRQLLHLGATSFVSGCADRAFEAHGTVVHPTQLSRETFEPGAPGYDELTRGYNVAYHDVRPRLITLPHSRDEIVRTLAMCQREKWPLHLRGGGHCFEDLNTGPGVLLDTRRMNRVLLANDRKTVTVEAGATLGAVHRALAPHGLTIPTGSCPSVGVAGLTMGGGYGLVSRKYGLTCDALVELELLDAQGRVHRVSRDENADLFWALRGGGGGSFGVVTQFTFSPKPITDEVCVLRARVRPELRLEFLNFWQSWITEGPDELTPLIYLAATARGIDGPVVLAQHCGNLSSARLALAPFWHFFESDSEIKVASALEATEYFGGKLDAPLEPVRFKSKSHFFKRKFTDVEWGAFVDLLEKPIQGLVGLMLDPWQGAISRVPMDATAFAHRDALFSIQYRADWGLEAGKAGSLEALDQLYTLQSPLSNGAYVNYSDKNLSNWRHAYHGVHLQRLVDVKRRYDPDGFFRHALSI